MPSSQWPQQASEIARLVWAGRTREIGALEAVLKARQGARALTQMTSLLAHAARARRAPHPQLTFQSHADWPEDVAAKLLELPPHFVRPNDLDAEAAAWIFAHTLDARPALVLEIGAGVSSVILALAMARLADPLGGPKLCSFASEERIDRTDQVLAQLGLGEQVVTESSWQPGQRPLLVLSSSDETELALAPERLRELPAGSEVVFGSVLSPAQRKLLQMLERAGLVEATEYLAVGRGVAVALRGRAG